MVLKSVVFLGLLFVVAVQAAFDKDFTQIARECMKGTDEEYIRNHTTDTGVENEDDPIMQNFAACCFGDFISDDNKLICNDDLVDYVAKMYNNRFDKKRTKLANVLAKACVENCKNTAGDTKGLAAVKSFNCLMSNFHMYLNDE